MFGYDQIKLSLLAQLIIMRYDIVRIILVFPLFFAIASCIPYNDGMKVGIRYSYAGKSYINLDDLRLSNPSQYVINFPNQVGDYCLVSFGDLIMQTTNNSMDIFTETSKCDFHYIAFSVRTDSLNVISKLSISYFSYYDQYLLDNTFQYYSSSAINSNISNDPSTSKIIYIIYNQLRYYYCNYINGMRQNCYYQPDVDLAAIILLNGFKVSSNNSFAFSISLATQLLASNNETKTVKVIIGSNYQVPTYLSAIAFTVFLQRTPYCGNQYYRPVRIYSMSISGSNNLYYTNDKHIMQSINSFVGLSSFHVSNQNQLSFQSSIIDKSILQFVSPNQFSIGFIIAYSLWCSIYTPFQHRYSLNSNGRCFDSCPSCTQLNSQFHCDQRWENRNECLKTILLRQQNLRQQNLQITSIFFYSLVTIVLIKISYSLFIKLSLNYQQLMKSRQEKSKVLNESVQSASITPLQSNESQNYFQQS